MKNKSLKKTALLAAMLLCIAPVNSQTIIYDGLMDSEFNIIRNYTDGVDITYNVWIGSHTFNYVDRNNGIKYSVDLSLLFSVSDFVIYDDYVYFCGGDGYNAVYGIFKINDLFFQGGTINYYPVIIPPDFPTVYSRIVHLDKIDVEIMLSGVTHILMTGRGYSHDEDTPHGGNYYYYPGAFVDVLVDNSGQHTIHYTVDDSYTYFYDDVAIVDDYAVVTAHGTEDVSPNMHSIIY